MAQVIHEVVIRYVEQGQGRLARNLNGIANNSNNASTAIAGIARGTAVFSGVAVTAAGVALKLTDMLANVGNEAITAADNIGKAAKALSLSAEELQEMRIVANDAGVSIDQLDDSFKDFQEKIGEFSRETGESVYWMDRWGISIKNTDGTLKSNKELYFEVGRAIAGMTDEFERTDAATKNLGSNGVAVVEMFRQTDSTIASTIATAREYGAVLTNEMVAGAEEYRSELDLIEQGTAALAVQRGLALAPLTREWELMKNKIANSVVSLFEFTGLLDMPVTKARVRVAELTADLEKQQEKLKKSGGKGKGQNSINAKLRAELAEAQAIVDAADEKARIEKEKRQKEEEQRDKDREERRLQEQAELEKKLADAKAEAEKKLADRQREQEKERAKQEKKDAIRNLKLMQDEIRQIQISATEDEMARAVAQTAFDIEQYKIRNEAVLTHTETRMEAEAALAAFIEEKYKELGTTLDELGTVRVENDTLMLDATHAGLANLTNSLVTFAETGEGSFKKMSESMLKEMAKIILQAQIMRALGITSGGQFTGTGLSGMAGIESTIPTEAANGAIVHGKQLLSSGITTMAEQGIEAIMPRMRNSQGVVVSGGSSDERNITYNNQITVTSNSADPKQVSYEVVQAIARKEAQNTYNQNAGRTTGRR